MYRPSAPLSVRLATMLTALGLLLAPLPAATEASMTPGSGQASARLDFRIVIPPVMQVIENSHPAQINGDQPVEQRLVVLSNMKNGFCASLRVQDPALAGWRLQTEEGSAATLQAASDGYRLCVNRPGRYAFRLQHDFGSTVAQAARAWPVQTDLMAL